MGRKAVYTAPNELRELQARLKEKEAEITMLTEVTDVIGSEYRLQKVFDLVAARAFDLLGAETVTIPILASDQKSYCYRAACGVNAEELRFAELPIEVGICGWVLRNRKPWWKGVLDQLDGCNRNKWEQEAGNLILVPLVGKRQFLGGIACINKIGEDNFNAHDFDLLGMFANQVSIAIENAMFFEELNAAKQSSEAYREKLAESNRKLLLSNEELQHFALHDPLTELPNRTLMLDRLQQGILTAKRNRHTLALIMIDLDHFKEVNDTLGHSVGDALLVGVGERFQSTLREPDTLGRLGGDEFAVVLPQADREAALTVVGKLQAALQRPLEIDHNNFSVAASMGIAVYPEHGNDPSKLLKSADVAMYIAKRNRDEYAIYNIEHDSYNPNRLELLNDLRAAIQQREIGIAFQPKLDLRRQIITGVEVLARWTHPTRGAIPPTDFIPVLEQTGLIKTFTLQILEKAVSYCKLFQDKGYQLGVAINLSMHNLRDENLPAQIATILDRYHLDKQFLMLEITESAIMHDPELSLDILTQLNKMGLQLSVDDFGTGYSSLSYLKRLPVQQLKIDHSFVSDMMGDKDDAMIVRSTIDLAHNLGLNTVAEGVETQEVLDRLTEIKCDHAQGFLISRPLSLDDFMSYLLAGEWEVSTFSEVKEAGRDY
ncbi:MAG TPA: EAL domain-containing protein [Gammaproteobacteria bacterium]|nr:EAL domain-containing protein [Gammaproteobacteria bacterium]